jgi:hypothetical protein
MHVPYRDGVEKIEIDAQHGDLRRTLSEMQKGSFAHASLTSLTRSVVSLQEFRPRTIAEHRPIDCATG